MLPDLYLGIVTGVHTRACIIDSDGHRLAQGFGGMSFTGDEAEAVKSIRAAVEEALSGRSLSDVKMVCASFWRPDSECEYFWALGLIEKVVGEIPIEITDHAKAALTATYGGGDGILVVGGDDSQALGVKDGMYARVGGWGDDFGDEACKSRIAIEGLRAVAKYADGRGEKTMMLADFCSTLDCPPRALRHRVLDEHVFYSDLSRVVFRCAEAGDLPAIGVVMREVRELILMAKTAVRRLDMPYPSIALVGSSFEVPSFREAFEKCARDELPDASVSKSEQPMEEGAAMLARMEAARPPDPPSDQAVVPPE